MKELARLNKYFLKYKWRFLLGIIFVGLSNYFRVLLPSLVRQALDLVVENLQFYKQAEGFELQAQLHAEVSTSLLFFAATIVFLAILVGIFMYFMRQTIIVMSRLIEYDMRKEIYAHFQRMDQAYFRNNFTGDLMSRIAEDVSKVRMYLGPATLYGINLSFLVIMVITAMFRVNTKLSLYALAPLPILSLSIYLVSSIIHKRSYLIQVQLSQLNSTAQEVYSGIKVVKSYVQEKAMVRYFSEQSEEFKKKSLDLARTNALFFPLMLVMIGISTIFVIYVGGIEVIAGNVSPGNIAEFVIYLNMLTWPVTSVGWVASLIQQASASQKRINELLDAESELEVNGDLHSSLHGSIEFRNVSFTYVDTGIEALKNVSFKLEAGQKMAIVGRTASGKTTIADLILRMYDPSEGQILIDNKELKAYDLNHLRDQIGYVTQDVFLFSDSIKSNIAFARPLSEDSAIKKHATHSNIDEEISSLPEAYDTVVGERGVTLSGGQRQRISISRALIKNPQIVLLDDCLSAVDANTENAILSHLNADLKDKTTIIITHRIPAQIDFDLILVLHHGHLVEFGKHEDLMALNHYYASMYRRQQLKEAYLQV